MSKPNIQVWKIDRLVPYELNSKIHNKEQIAKIAKSIGDFGWSQPIVVDEAGMIIAGHGRRLAALSLGLKEVPVWVRDDLDTNQVRALRLADNRVAEGDIDTNLFRKELETLDFDLVGIFDEKELDFSMADLGEMNTDFFIEDVNAAVTEQQDETRRQIASAADRDVSIAKALGFKHVSGADEIYISKFMSRIMADFKTDDPATAFVGFIKAIQSDEVEK